MKKHTRKGAERQGKDEERQWKHSRKGADRQRKHRRNGAEKTHSGKGGDEKGGQGW